MGWQIDPKGLRYALNGTYSGKLGILWLDSHPDVSTPKDIERVHAMILVNVLGGGSPKSSGSSRTFPKKSILSDWAKPNICHGMRLI
ncbi:hypothetical protein SAMN05216375_10359 [Trichococcus ilyis]|uniref:Uncharacterized protein n=1 Tax=Trichococcus ilyis TaxID=640938 RepID=A0A143YIW9_9LACT|nr:Hypothetical protein TR210_928 [Trichococcus ilyis]SEI73412.1 hypothetical protein SAMN05216375_10359 [Trichococcus ilyis]